MRIVQLQATNVKRIKAIDLTFKDGVTVFSGLNGQGKSSAADCLFYALGGKEALPGEPVRKGQDKATIKVGLGTDIVELVVKRTIPKDGPTTLIVESPDGARYPSPQAMLDGMWNAIAVDPPAFIRMPPKEQASLLRKVAKLDIDVDALDALNLSDFNKRTDINRQAKQKKAQADGVAVPDEVKGAIVDESALVGELEAAGKTNAEIETKKGRRELAKQTIAQMTAQAAELKVSAVSVRTAADAAYTKAGQDAQEAYDRAKKVAETAYAGELKRATGIEELAAAGLADVDELQKKLSAAPPLAEPVDTADLRRRIDAAKATNKAIADRAEAVKRKADLAGEATRLDVESKALTASIDARNKEKDDAIKGAAMPVEGLGFADGVVTYQGLPFDQASQAEQLRVSMAVALASNPKLRVVLIREGSLLDDNSLALVAEMAAAAKAQVFIEVVDGSGKVGIVFEDGLVVSSPEIRAAQEKPQ